MTLENSWRQRNFTTIVLFSLLASGCQNLPMGSQATTCIDKSMQGETAREQYAYMVETISTLNRAMARDDATLPGLPLDDALVAALSPDVQMEDKSDAESVIRLAEQQLIAKGPCRLVQADTFNGRMEYRSARSGQHVSITVRPATRLASQGATTFVVTDVFGQNIACCTCR